MSIIQFLIELKELNVFIHKNEQKLSVKGDRNALTADLKNKLRANKEDIVKIFDQLDIDSNKQLAPTTFSQQRLWIIDQLEGNSVHYNMPGQMSFTGKTDIDALNKTVSTIINRHQSLRTCFYNENGIPYQVIKASTDVVVPICDLSQMSPEQRAVELQNLVRKEANNPFLLSQDLMLRVTLIIISEAQNVLLYSMHHIASDGWSIGILYNEFGQLYNAFVAGESDPLPPLAIQYADYAHWQRKWLDGEVLEKQLNYWEQNLRGLPAVHNLPLDYPRPAIQSFNGQVFSSLIDSKTAKLFGQYCLENGATLFMGLHALFSILLGRYSGETDIVIGTPIANREQPDVAPLIGFFLNTLVLRADLSRASHFKDLLSQSTQLALKAYTYQQVPFEQLVKNLNIAPSRSYSPVFQIMLILQNNEDGGEVYLQDIEMGNVDGESSNTKFDLTLNASEADEGLYLGWDFCVDLFDLQTIKRLASSFEVLMDAVIAKPLTPLMALPVQSADEQQHLLNSQLSTLAPIENVSIEQLFEQYAEQKADTVAVIFEDSQITYGQLNHQANQLANYLISAKQLKSGQLVGLCVNRSIEMIIGLLAILKAGGAYVPLDPDYPPDRIAYMLADTKLETLITQNTLRDKHSMAEQQVVCLDDPAVIQQLSEQPINNIARPKRPSDNLAYVVYTSGSTGQPKGVMVNHHNWLSYHQAITQLYGLSSDERILQLSSISFDIFIEELTVSLFSGGTLVIPTAEKVLSCGQFWDSLDKYQISVASLPTALWHQLCVDPQLSAVGKPHSLRLIITGGEAMSASHLTMWQQRAPKNIQLLNTYGPTEATVIASCFDVSDYDPGLNSVPIGMSTKNSSLIVLDQHQKMVPKGVVGELYIGGEGVATGYLNQTQMTQDSFVTNPYNIDASPRLYKTGDLVRVLADDNFEFIGRTDDQVKIRGFRIVMGEIEHQISQCHEVKSNLVCAIEDEDKQKRLVAYIQLVAQADLDPLASIRQHLQQVLPEYMIPSALVVIEDWPLTANGKIDQQQLPLPDIDLLQNKYSAAQTKTENTLVQIWADLLKQAPEKVSVQANFFDLGGHSLLLIRLNAQMEFDYSIKFPVHELYNHSTIEQQAKLVDRLLNSTADDLTITEVIEADNHSSEANVVLLKQGDSQLPPLYFIHPVGGQVACYITLVNQLNYSGSIYGIHRTNASELSIEAVAGQYNELIFNHNEQQVPCRLVGWSMGGVVAYEMAQQLNQAANIDLIMIDSYNPAANAADTSLSAEDLNLQILNIMLNELGISYGHVPEDTFNQPLTELLTLALQLGKEQQVFPSTFSFESLTKRFEVLRENSRALTGYKPAKYGGKVSLLKAKDSQGYQPHGWDKLVTNLSVSVVEGEHFSLMLKPDVLGVADKLNGIDWTSDRVTLNR